MSSSSSLLRVTGINSGLDTESIISALTSKYQTRITNAQKQITLNEYTQEAWKSLNSKIYSFYSGKLATNRMSSVYSQKKTTTSNSALSVVASDTSTNGVMTAKIQSTAKAAYLTGSKLQRASDTTDSEGNTLTGSISSSEKLTEALGITEGSTFTLKDSDGNAKATIQVGGTAADSSVTVVNTMNELTAALKAQGLNANFDSGNQRLFVSAKDTGASNDFSFDAEDDNGLEALVKLGVASSDTIDKMSDSKRADLGLVKSDELSTLSEEELAAYNAKLSTKIDGSDAKLILNGAEFTSNTNTFTINGSTYTVNSMPADPDEEISITTATDYDGIYDVVRNMLSEYNDLVNEMSTLYNADSADDYDPLTSEQKAEMTDDEITDWTNKIKDSILRKDSTLYDVLNTLTNTMSEGITVNGKTMYLSDFGISTLGYFEAEENERYALHIDGDANDSSTSSNEDKLKSMIASDPDTVTSFFSQLSQKLYTNLYAKMGTSSLSSVYKVYNDKELESDKSDWEDKLEEYEDALADAEDRYYTKFTAMETALSKLNSQQSSLSSLFG